MPRYSPLFDLNPRPLRRTFSGEAARKASQLELQCCRLAEKLTVGIKIHLSVGLHLV